MVRFPIFVCLFLSPLSSLAETIAIAGCRAGFEDFSIVAARGVDLQEAEQRSLDLCSQQISGDGCCHLMASADVFPGPMCLAVFGVHSQADDRIVRYVSGINEDEAMSYGQEQSNCLRSQEELGLENSGTCVYVGSACDSFYPDEGTPASELP